MILSKVVKTTIDINQPQLAAIRQPYDPEGYIICSTQVRIVYCFFITPFCYRYSKDNRMRPDVLRSFTLVITMAQEFARSFYSSKRWQACRNEYMKKAHYLCENCLRKGIYKPAKYVHHIEELTPFNINNPEIALGFGNLEAVCRECHDEYHDNHGRWTKVNEERRKKREAGQRYSVDKFGRVTAK